MTKVMDIIITLFGIGLLVLGAFMFWDGLVEGFNEVYTYFTSK